MGTLSNKYFNAEAVETALDKGVEAYDSSIELKEDLSELENRTSSFDGIINPEMELGNITMRVNELIYTDSTTRIRTPQNKGVQVVKGDIIKLTDYTNARFYIAIEIETGVYVINGWRDSDYTVQNDGIAYILARCEPETSVGISSLKVQVIKKDNVPNHLVSIDNNISSLSVAHKDLEDNVLSLSATGRFKIDFNAELNGINANTGLDFDSNAFIRSKGFMLLDGIIGFEKNNSSILYFFKYDANGTFVKRYYYRADITSGEFIADKSYKYRICYGHIPADVITDVDLAKSEFNVYSQSLSTKDYVNDVNYATINAFENGVSVFNDNYELNDGYYTANGVIHEPSDINNEKYLTRIEVTEGVKVSFRISWNKEDTALTKWVALCTWSEDGTFTRELIFNINNVPSVFYNYIVPSGIKYVSFCTRVYSGINIWFSVDRTNIFESKIANLSDSIAELHLASSPDFLLHKIKGVNHRGYSYSHPENTMSAFKESVVKGFYFLETDVRFTSDEVAVLLHDATVDRTSNGTGAILGMTFEQARSLDFGSWKSSVFEGEKIPSFEEFIIFCRNHNVFPYIEVSGENPYTDSKMQNLVNIVKKYDMLRSVTWISFYPTNLQKVLSNDRMARVGYITEGAIDSSAIEVVNSLRTNGNLAFIDLKYASITDNGINLAIENGVPVEIWTIDNVDTMLSLNPYISGVTSNRFNFEDAVKNDITN